jgi:putative acetyltransferase
VTGFHAAADDPRARDVLALLETHLAFARSTSPPEDTHALDLIGLLDESVSFYSVRGDGELVGIGALKELDATHVEIKSMHTAANARRQGVGRVMLEHLIETARCAGYERVSLETGSVAAFAPARALYASAGFAVCEPFGNYRLSPNSTYMTLVLHR